MRKLIMLTAALGRRCGAATTASAQHLDDKGKCRDEKNKFAAMSLCKH